MGRYLAGRLISTLVVLILVSFISFCIMQMVPGDPAQIMAGAAAPPDEVQRIREQFGLDQPFHVQMLRWYGGMLRGDLGTSITLSRSVVAAIVERLPSTVALAGFAFVLTLVFGLVAGVGAALKQDSWVDHTIMTLAVVGVSVPSFWIGLIMIIGFAVMVDWLPAGGYVTIAESPSGWFRSLILPSIALALLQMGLLARITRATMIEVLRQDFVRTAQAKGLSRWMVVGKHAFMNVMVPVVTVIGIVFSLLLSGSVVIETVFSIPGLGRLMATSIVTRDYPVIQGALLITAAMFVLINLAVDVLYAYLDPRIHYD
ncbi:MAG: ABC transporter permease [Alphaproteobacteria bacterium]|nr:ABC transporter permease [Alphaproteobacteria bacterium]